jgi:hypothetical protein
MRGVVEELGTHNLAYDGKGFSEGLTQSGKYIVTVDGEALIWSEAIADDQRKKIIRGRSGDGAAESELQLTQR